MSEIDYMNECTARDLIVMLSEERGDGHSLQFGDIRQTERPQDWAVFPKSCLHLWLS